MLKFMRLAAALVPAAALVCSAAHASELKVSAFTEKRGPENNPMLCATFNDDLSQLSWLDLRKYISIEGEDLDNSLSPLFSLNGDTVCVRGLRFETPYRMTIKAGLTGNGGKSLSQDQTYEITTMPEEQRLSLKFAPGDVADLSYRSVLFESVNLQQVRLTAVRVPLSRVRRIVPFSHSGPAIGVNNAAELLKGGYVKGQSLIAGSRFNRHSRLSGEYLLSTGKAPETAVMIVASDPLLSFDQAAEIAAGGNDNVIWGAVIDRHTSMQAQIFKTGETLLVSVHSALSAAPERRARVSVLNDDGKELATGLTAENGIASLHGDFKSGLRVRVLSGHGPDSLTELIPADSFRRGVCSTNPSSCPDTVNAFTDRQIYSPGESVNYLALVRSPDLRAGGGSRYYLDVITPEGGVYRTLKLEDQGGHAFCGEFKLPPLLLSGTWRLRLSDVFGKEVSLTSVRVRNPEDHLYSVLPGTEGPVSGGSAAQTRRRSLHPFPEYPEYFVGSQAFRYELELNPSEGIDRPHQENSLINPLERIQDPDLQAVNVCGIAETVWKGENALSIRLFNAKGSPLSGRAWFTIYRIERAPAYMHTTDGWKFVMKRSFSRLMQGMLSISRDRLESGMVPFPPEPGEYLIQASTVDGFRTSLMFMRDSGRVSYTADHLYLKADKLRRVGENAVISFESPKAGRGEIIIDSASGRQILPLEAREGHNFFTIPVTKGLGKDVRVRIQLFYLNAQIRQSQVMACGQTQFQVSRPDAVMLPRLEIADDSGTTPGSYLKVAVKSLSGSEQRYQLTAVSVPYAYRDQSSLDLFTDDQLDFDAIKTFYSSPVLTPRKDGSSVRIPLQHRDQRVRIILRAWSDESTGFANRSVDISYPQNLVADLPEALHTGDVLLPDIVMTNNVSSGDFALDVSCAGTVRCGLKRSVSLLRGDTAYVSVPITALKRGSGQVKISLAGKDGNTSLVRRIQVSDPWDPRLFTRSLRLKPGEKLEFMPLADLSESSVRSVECGTMPYVNTGVYNRVLLDKDSLSLQDRLAIAIALMNGNYELLSAHRGPDAAQTNAPGGLTVEELRSLIQRRLDIIASFIRADGSVADEGPLGTEPVPAVCYAQVCFETAKELGFEVSEKQLAALQKRTRAYINDPLIPAPVKALALSGSHARYQSQEDIETAIGFVEKHEIKSPAVLALTAAALVRSGISDVGYRALHEASDALSRMLELRKRLRNPNAWPETYSYLSELNSFRELPEETVQHSAAAVLAAAAAFGTGDLRILRPALTALAESSFTEKTQPLALGALLSQHLMVPEGDRREVLPFPENGSRTVLENPTARPRYCTASVYGIDTERPQNSDGQPLDIKISWYAQNRELSGTPKVLRSGDEVLMILECSRRTPGTSPLTFTAGRIPGLEFVRFAEGLEPQYPRTPSFIKIERFRNSEHGMIFNAGSYRSKSFCIGVIMRATRRGTFTVPAVSAVEDYGSGHSVFYSDEASVKVE